MVTEGKVEGRAITRKNVEAAKEKSTMGRKRKVGVTYASSVLGGT